MDKSSDGAVAVMVLAVGAVRFTRARLCEVDDGTMEEVVRWLISACETIVQGITRSCL